MSDTQLLYVQYCQEITYQKPRPRRGHFASALRPLPPAGASMLRPLCVRVASTLRLRALAAASVLRALCVQCASLRACGRSHKILFVDRRKISRFAFSLRNVGVGIRFHASDFNHLTRVSRIVYQWQQQKTFFINLAMLKLSPYARNRVISLSTQIFL